VIEVGAGNPYGHPAPSTVKALGSAVPAVFRTDRDGEVTLSLDPAGLEARARSPGSGAP
jgi:competence protein ComEC